jgi:HEAT repeat protein
MFPAVVLAMTVTASLLAEDTPSGVSEADIRALVRQLGAENYEDRENASKKLAEVGAPAIPVLLGVLEDKDPEIRMRSESVLREIGGKLVDGLGAEDPRPAFEALKQLGRRAFPQLAEFGKSDDVKVHYLVARIFAVDDSSASTSYLAKVARNASEPAQRFALGELARRRAVEELLQCVEDGGSEEIEEAAAEAVIKVGDTRILPKLREKLDEAETLNRALILRIIVALDSDILVEKLEHFLRDKDELPAVRVEAAAALDAVGGEKAREPLFRMLQEMDPDTCVAAVRALKNVSHPDLIPFLHKQLASEDSRARRTTLTAIASARLTETAASVVKLLSDPDRNVRLDAVATLGEFRSAEAIPKIVGALADADPDIRYAAIMAIRKIGGQGPIALLAAVPGVHRLVKEPQALPHCQALVKAFQQGNKEEDVADAAIELIYKHELLTHSSPEIRHRAAIALYRLGEGVAKPVLLQALQDTDVYVRLAAAEHLGPMGEEEAIPALTKALDDEALLVQRAAAHGLGGLGAVKAAPRLLDILRDETAWPELRKVAATSLATIGYEPAYPHFRTLLTSPEVDVRIGAASALATLGEKACVPAFLSILREGSPHQRKQAHLCLRQFTSQSFEFDPDGPRKAQDEAIRRWEKWWEEAGQNSPHD